MRPAVNIEEGTSRLRTHHTHSLRALPSALPVNTSLVSVAHHILQRHSESWKRRNCTQYILMKRTVNNVSTLITGRVQSTSIAVCCGIQGNAVITTPQSITVLHNLGTHEALNIAANYTPT